MTISYDVADGQRTNRAGEPQVLGPDAKKGDARLVGAEAAAAAGGPTLKSGDARAKPADGGKSARTGTGTGTGSGTGKAKAEKPEFHRRTTPPDLSKALENGVAAVRRNLLIVLMFSCVINVLVLSIPVYLFQISDRVLTSRSLDTLVMLTGVIVGAVLLQAAFDAIRRFILMRTAVELASQLGSPILAAAARASLNSNGKEYQILNDLQQLRGFLVSGTMMAFLDGPFAPLFLVAIYLIHPHLGMIVGGTCVILLVIAVINQKITSRHFSDANQNQSKANLHLDAMSRNSQIINALAMIPEAVHLWGRDTAASLRAQVSAQDRNIVSASITKAVRLLTQVAMLGWGSFLAIQGELTGGMVIAASIIGGRALSPIEGAIEGWNQYLLSRNSYGRISTLLKSSPLNSERLVLPKPQGRLDVERLLYVPQGTKRVVLNSITFSLKAGDFLRSSATREPEKPHSARCWWDPSCRHRARCVWT